MEKLVRARRPVRRHVKKMCDELDVLINIEPLDLPQVTAKLALLEERNLILKDWDSKIMNEMQDTDVAEADENKEMDEANEFQMEVEVLKIRLNDLLKPKDETMSSRGSVGETRRRSANLPVLQTVKFTGELLDWLPFWGHFQKIHEDEDLHASDKFAYLMQALTKGTEAYQMVASYPQSVENYPKAVAALKKRYGNEDMLLQVYLRKLLELVIANVNTKEKTPFSELYLKLDAHYRALMSLNLKNADPATWLFPLVESSLPEKVLDNWQRDPLSSHDGSRDEPPKTRLDLLMEFMEREVNIRQRIEIAQSFVADQRAKPKTNTNVEEKAKESRFGKKRFSTVTGFHVSDTERCIFCNKNHRSVSCHKAMTMSDEVKEGILKKNGLCFKCLGKHFARSCPKKELVCKICGGNHYSVVCRKRKLNSTAEEARKGKQPRIDNHETSIGMANMDWTTGVLLQTLVVTLVNGERRKQVRVFLDNGSQKSYILKSTVAELGLEQEGEERVSHSLFGGRKTAVVVHGKYSLQIEDVNQRNQLLIGVRDQDRICGQIRSLSRRDNGLIEELKQRKIHLTDVGMDQRPIELLLGADVYGKLLTGNVKKLRSGPVAMETKLGWTLIGEMTGELEMDSFSTTMINLSVRESSISKLWELEILGIKDPADIVTAAQRETEVKASFLKKVKRDESGRYVVQLPWKLGHPSLPTNKAVAVKRLQSTSRKLLNLKLFKCYGKLFQDWEKESFIERVPEEEEKKVDCHYLPHRAVVKPGSLTTPARPVFDASCKLGKFPSLNDCLEKGENLMQLIPEILIGFRKKEVGFVSDIRKAFQMVGVHSGDRDFLRFLWWKNEEMKEMIEYRHARVPFGATCSPFILGAVLESHLKNCSVGESFGRKLLKTLYVDNCVSSENTVEDYEKFKSTAVDILKECGMDLRMWLSSVDGFEEEETQVISVLGLLWNRRKDELSVDLKKITEPAKVTKRTILSAVQKVFDPIGFTSPAILPMKMLLQKTWINQLKWDEELPDVDAKVFLSWLEELPSLGEIQIRRKLPKTENGEWSLHTFTDASRYAYGAVVFLRALNEGECDVQLVAAKSRVAPVNPKDFTKFIPRMELLGCLVGARLSATVKTGLDFQDGEEYLWTDSTTALAWIRRDDQWGTFVGNRVKQVLEVSKGERWRHVPGKMNPADLPSRGCLPSQLLESKWWEGPRWIRDSKETWPSSEPLVDESKVNLEKKRAAAEISMCVTERMEHGHSFLSLCRIYAWMKRFCYNSKPENRNRRKNGRLSITEEKLGERALLYLIQCEAFSDEDELEEKAGERRVKKMKRKDSRKAKAGLEIVCGTDGLLRVKTKMVNRVDDYGLRFPILLPGSHAVVKQLIWDSHVYYCHAGVGFLVTKLREKYWILQGRQTVKKVLRTCYRCRRYTARATVTEAAALPLDRVKDARPFQVTGVDLAGPLMLKNGRKMWMVIYTCGTYRAVHLSLIDSLSTPAFIRDLKTFVERFGRPEIIYSDNGTNFRGADNIFRRLNWKSIQEEDEVKRITFKFNVSTGSWWGGWWERLIRSVKGMIRRTLGQSCVSRGELEAVIKRVEEVMNSRPLTYISEDAEDLEPLTPAHFVSPWTKVTFPELQMMEAEKLRFRFKYVETLKKELQQRWRKEYLAMLVSRPQKVTRALQVGELVVISRDGKKRVDWPLARILDLIPGLDGVPRVAKVKTSEGVYMRPVQRLHALELEQSGNEEENREKRQIVTRSGRVSRRVERFSF